MDATRDDPPEVSWVMGRSARWHTPHGRALLAEDAAEERRDQALAAFAVRSAAARLDGGIDPLEAAALLVRLARLAWRLSRRRM